MNKRMFSFLVVILMTIGLIIPCANAKAIETTKNSININTNNIHKNKAQENLKQKNKNFEIDKNLSKNKQFIAEDLIHKGLLKSSDGKNITWNDIKKSVDVIDVLSINDFHGAVLENGKNIGAAKLAYQIKKLKKENPNTILTTGGDLYQGTATSNLLMGKPVNVFLKEVGVDISAIGNHEFDWGEKIIPTWEKEGNFEFLACNIYDKKTDKPVTWVKPYDIFEKGGKRIAFIGLATPETKFKTKPQNVENLEFKDAIKLTNYWAEYLRKNKKVDAVLVVSHLGSIPDFKTHEIRGEAVELAKHSKGIDAIISGHTHLPVDGVVNGIPIVQGYCNGRGLTDLSLVFNKNGKLEKVYHSIDLLYKRIKNLPEDLTTKQLIDKCTEKLKPILEEKVCRIDYDLPRGQGVTALGEFISKYMAKASDAKIGITNGGGLRMALQKGDITVGDMWGVMPFDNSIVKMDLKGSDLKRVLENGVANPNVGWVQFYGLKVYYDKDAKLGNKITSMRLLDGSKVNPDKYYPIVTNDFMYKKGDNYDFTGAKNIKNTHEPIRDAVIDKLKKEKNIPFKYEECLIEGKDPKINEVSSEKSDIEDNKAKSVKANKQSGKVTQNHNKNNKSEKATSNLKSIDITDNANLNNDTKNKIDEKHLNEIPTTGSGFGTKEALDMSILSIILGTIIVVETRSKKIS